MCSGGITPDQNVLLPEFSRGTPRPLLRSLSLTCSPNYVFAVLSKQFPVGEGVGEAAMTMA